MSDRTPLDDLTSDQLDALHDRLDAAEQEVTEVAAAAAHAITLVGKRAERAEADRDAARDRLDFMERDTLPDLRRRAESDAATIKRWRDRAETAEAEVTRLTAGQCLDSRRMCQQHHTPPVTGCPYPQCVTARQQQETGHA